MKIYHYSQNTGELLTSENATPNPLEPGEYLLPAGATFISPPTPGQNEKPMWNGSSWDLVDDYRSQTFYSKDTGEETPLMLGEVPDDSVTTQPRTDSEALFDNDSDAWAVPIDILIERKRVEINAARTSALSVATVFFKGEYFDADLTTQNNLSNVLMAINAGIFTADTIEWRTTADTMVILQITELPTLGALMYQETTRLYQKSWDLKNQFEVIIEMDYESALTTLSELTWD